MVHLYVVWLLFLLCNMNLDECSIKISSKELNEYIAERQWVQSACILFHKRRKSDIKKFEAAESHVTSLHHEHLFFRANISEITTRDPSILKKPHVRCYVKRSKPLVFYLSDGSLNEWMASVVTSPSDINFIYNEDIETLSRRSNVLVMVVLPTLQYFQELEELFLKILHTTEKIEIDVHFIPPGTNIERIMNVKLMQVVEAYPSVLIYYRQDKQHPLSHVVTLSGPHEVTEELVRLNILLRMMKEMQVTTGQFEMLMTSARYSQESHSVLALYSSTSSSSYRFLHAFYRTARAFKEDYTSLNTHFFIVDISEDENSEVLSTNIKVFSGWSIPFILCLHVNSDTNSVTQSIMPEQVTPTFHSVKRFLQGLGLVVEEDRPCVNHWSNTTCSTKGSSFCSIGDQPVPISASSKKNATKQTRKVKRHGHLYTIDEGSWDAFVTLSTQPSNIEKLQGKKKLTSRLHLVIFIAEGCSYCKMVMPEFESLARSVKYLPGVSVFLMNCSNSKRKCSEYNVAGYPTLILFRVIPWSDDKCVPREALLEPAIVDYHGDYEAPEILSWLSDQKSPIIKYLENLQDEPMHKDVRLVGYLYTKEFVQKYMHFSMSQLLPLRCFLILCELFYSQVDCVGVAEKGNVLNVNTELFLSSIQFTRKDGAQATLFKFGFSMESTLKEEVIGDAAMFHKPHNYMLDSDTKCEDDQEKCMMVMIEFLQDHIRMPVIHIDTGTLHSHQKSMNYLRERPILISLAHPDNVTANSSFYQDLYQLGIDLYQKVNVALIDVSEYPQWANRFVPVDYWGKLKNDEEPFLLRFPRFVLIDMNDHSRAAFYPPLEEYVSGKASLWNRRLDYEKLLTFVDKYLTNRDTVITETEHF